MVYLFLNWELHSLVFLDNARLLRDLWPFSEVAFPRGEGRLWHRQTFILRNMSPLQFKPINLDINASTCLKFERDMNWISSGEQVGEDDAQRGARFLEKIAAKLADDSRSCLHVWRESTLIGQLHLGRFFEEPVGYVHFLYLAPEYRGLGWAPLLDEYACRRFAERSFLTARLSVDARNQRARRFYQSQHWSEIGVRPDNPARLMLEKFTSK